MSKLGKGTLFQVTDFIVIHKSIAMVQTDTVSRGFIFYIFI